MDLTRKQLTNVERVDGLHAPMNSFANVDAYPTADMRVVVRPNFDTLYSSAWLDLTKEPMIVSAPNTDGRYYMLPMLDMWTDVFASPGWRTTGTEAKNCAIIPPGWIGKLPKGVERIDSPTAYVWIIGRTIRLTVLRLAAGCRSALTLTAPSISISRTKARSPTRKPTGCRHQRDRSI
jgi:hypothetical protein